MLSNQDVHTQTLCFRGEGWDRQPAVAYSKLIIHASPASCDPRLYTSTGSGKGKRQRLRMNMGRSQLDYVHTYTVKPVYNDHSRDQVIMVFVDRWSLCRGAIVLFWWFLDQSTVVSIDRWSFYKSGLYDRFHCTYACRHSGN